MDAFQCDYCGELFKSKDKHIAREKQLTPKGLNTFRNLFCRMDVRVFNGSFADLCDTCFLKCVKSYARTYDIDYYKDKML